MGFDVRAEQRHSSSGVSCVQEEKRIQDSLWRNGYPAAFITKHTFYAPLLNISGFFEKFGWVDGLEVCCVLICHVQCTDLVPVYWLWNWSAVGNWVVTYIHMVWFSSTMTMSTIHCRGGRQPAAMNVNIYTRWDLCNSNCLFLPGMLPGKFASQSYNIVMQSIAKWRKILQYVINDNII